jgi:chemotaxis family two-component system sensor histidine kinase/response regulator PixL
MSQDKEREIKLQFLDEAEDYLNTLETALLGMSQGGIILEDVKSALRSAHSIKGGAGLMGYPLMSDLAHRLETVLKVLKGQRETLVVDTTLEGLLLAGVDTLKQVIQCDRTQTTLTPAWLETTAIPIFTQLQEILGEADPESANDLLASDENQSILPVIFETEVEGCLGRLENAIAVADPRLKEEVTILAQELGGLGEMLQLSAFTQLCQRVEAAIQGAHADQIAEVAQAALTSWRQAQSSVLANQLAQIPTQLTGLSFTPPEFASPAGGEGDTHSWPTPLAATNGVDDMVAFDEMLVSAANDQALAFLSPPLEPTVVVSPTLAEAEPNPADIPAAHTAQETEFRFSEASTPLEPSEGEPEATVRVSVRQLNELNDYFGELTIERHRLESEVKRLRSLAVLLNERLASLGEISQELREVYDKTSSTVGREAKPQLLLAGTPSETSLGPLANAFTSVTATTVSPSATAGFDSLEMDRYDARHLPFRDMMETAVRLQEVTDDIELSVDTTEQSARNIQRTSRQLQRNLNQLRMRPLSDITNRFPRALRELSREYDKPIELLVDGESTLIDRNILEALSDPLMHILRNAFDHGIEPRAIRRAQGKPEQGKISIKAQHRSNRTLITISDDGSGIPLDKIKDRAREMGLDETLLANASDTDLLSLIFEPGFSTADQVTALSGRGVGMDVVRNNLKKIRGDISVSTQPNQGSTFTISVPYTLSVTRVLLAESNHLPMAFPTDNLQEITLVAPETCYQHNGHECFNWHGHPTRLIKMSQWLAFNCPRQIEGLENLPNVSVPSVLIFAYGDQWVGLQIDRSWGEQEVAVRRIEGPVALPSGFSNCTILGDGKVVPLVNVSDLLRWIFSCEGSNIQSAAVLYGNPIFSGNFGALSLQSRVTPTQSVVLIVDDSVNVRRLLALTLEKQGYQVVQAKDGLDALEKLEAGLEVHAIVCDIEMPRLDGYGFLARLRANAAYGQLPITMLTSRTGDKHRQLAMKLGANAYFSKPYREQALLKTLEDVIRPALAS